MKKTGVLTVLFICALLPVFTGACRVEEKPREKVVFIDLETVIAEEKKRIFSLVLRGEISREEAENRVGRFFVRFGDVLSDYVEKGYLVLDSKAVLGGGRDATEEILNRLSSRQEKDE